jgi:6-phosphofructokinase 1
MNTAQDALDKLRDTAYSHERCSVIEVMGRHAGHIALNVAVAGGAEAVLIPEKGYSLDEDILKPIIEGRNRGKKNYIVIVAEGVGKVPELTAQIQAQTGIESRATILGYIQRGGSPSVKDRVTAARMGVRAVELVREGARNRVIGTRGDGLVDYDITEALAMEKGIDESLFAINRVLSI